MKHIQATGKRGQPLATVLVEDDATEVQILAAIRKELGRPGRGGAYLMWKNGDFQYHPHPTLEPVNTIPQAHGTWQEKYHDAVKCINQLKNLKDQEIEALEQRIKRQAETIGRDTESIEKLQEERDWALKQNERLLRQVERDGEKLHKLTDRLEQCQIDYNEIYDKAKTVRSDLQSEVMQLKKMIVFHEETIKSMTKEINELKIVIENQKLAIKRLREHNDLVDVLDDIENLIIEAKGNRCCL